LKIQLAHIDHAIRVIQAAKGDVKIRNNLTQLTQFCDENNAPIDEIRELNNTGFYQTFELEDVVPPKKKKRGFWGKFAV